MEVALSLSSGYPGMISPTGEGEERGPGGAGFGGSLPPPTGATPDTINITCDSVESSQKRIKRVVIGRAANHNSPQDEISLWRSNQSMAMAALPHATARRLACSQRPPAIIHRAAVAEQPRRLLHRGSSALGRNFSPPGETPDVAEAHPRRFAFGWAHLF